MKRVTGVAAMALLSSVALAAQTTDKTHQQGSAEHRTGQAAAHMSEKDFVPMMLQHHEDGIEMARIAEQKATSPAVKALARKIREGQERESHEMKPFAGRTDTPRGTTGQGGHQAEHEQHMQESKKAIERIRAATGKAVDVAFLDEMTKHHEMAIRMTNETHFDTAKLKQMAEKMKANQTKEIGELKRTRQQVS
jgi:uncharacterized protein (DUF305 family)